MTNPLDPQRNPEVAIDVELVATGKPGWGAALRRLRERAGVKQFEVADALEIDKSNVSKWEAEEHRPADAVLRKALTALRTDTRLLFRYFGVTLLGDRAEETLSAQLDVKAASSNLAETLLAMKGSSSLEAQSAIAEAMGDKVFAAVSLKALAGSEKAAQIFFERADRLAELQARTRLTRNVTPEQFSSCAPFIHAARQEQD